jgi:hypothetical protein
MKKLLLSTVLFAGVFSANAQTAVGTAVGDFTLTDINGNTHNLYSYLDAGKFVVIDVSATWCGPCWNYHNTGALDDFYVAHGPAGDNTAMALFIEGDVTTNTADLHGTGTNTQGDWVTGENLPIIDLATSASFTSSGLVIPYYPVMYVICPNRTVLASGVAGAIGTTASLNGYIGDCPAPASQANDPALLSYLGINKSCGAIDLIVKLQNNGTSPLTSCVITASEGANVIATYPWTGNLATYGMTNVTVGQFTPTTASHNISIAVTSADNNAANNVLTEVVGIATIGSSNNVTVKVSLDHYGSETSWKIKRSNGQVAYSSPAYSDAAANGTYAQPDINIVLPDDCYSLEVTDSYGDGFDPDYGNGFVEVWSNGVKVGSVGSTTDFSSDFESDAFQLDAVAGIQEMLNTSLNVFPNPASDVVNVTFEADNADYTIAIVDLQGRVMTSQELTSLNGSQSIALPVNNLAKGSYIVTISSNGVSTSKNVVIK